MRRSETGDFTQVIACHFRVLEWRCPGRILLGLDHEPATELLCRQRLEIGADLVGNVAAARRAVGSRDDDVDKSVLHQVSAGIVHDQRVRHAALCQFPCRQLRTLVARSCFVDPHMHVEALLVRDVPLWGVGALAGAIRLAMASRGMTE